MLIRDPKKWSRRRLLAGFGAGAALYPFVPLLPSLAEAQTAEKIKRYVQWFYPLGTNPEKFFPTGGETDFQLSNVLEPLQALRDDLVVFGGLDMTKCVANPHDAGAPFTGSVANTDLIGPGPGYGDPGIVAYGTSVDQYLADRWGKDKPYSLIQLDICNAGGPLDNPSPLHHACSRREYVGIPGENDPYAAFDRLFAGAAPTPAGPDPAAERSRRNRGSVLDHVVAELGSLRNRSIHQGDRDLLDAHLEGIRSIERRLQSPGVGAACTPPVVDKNGRIDPLSFENLLVLGKLQMDIGLAALACDLTRVLAIQWMRIGTDESIPFLDVDNYHGLTHSAPGDPGMLEKVREISRMWHEQLAYFAQRLKDTPEGDGTMLDHTIILSASEVSEPQLHSSDHHPYLLVGGKAAYRTGRYLQFEKIYSNRLFVSICNAVGFADVQKYGCADKTSDHPEFRVDRGTGPIPGFFS